jgi:CRP-like cAMP-binding protein
MVSRN